MALKDTPRPGKPDGARTHDDLIPREAVFELQGPKNAAYSPRRDLGIPADFVTLEALHRGLREIVSERDNLALDLDSKVAQLRRSESVVRIYIQFIENITKGKQSAAYIREAATHLLGLMY